MAAACILALISGCAGGPALPLAAAPPPPASSSATSAPASPISGGAGAAAGAVPSPSPAVGGRAAAAPASLWIPAIDVASALPPLGLTADGSAEVPTDYDLAGWFSGGGRPGANGPTVLLGHVDSTSGPGVFYRLRELRPGDVVEVTATDGAVARYSVERSENVPKDGFPTFEVYGAVADDVLRLVTCTGAFDRGARSYVDNLVVSARRLP